MALSPCMTVGIFSLDEICPHFEELPRPGRDIVSLYMATLPPHLNGASAWHVMEVKVGGYISVHRCSPLGWRTIENTGKSNGSSHFTLSPLIRIEPFSHHRFNSPLLSSLLPSVERKWQTECRSSRRLRIVIVVFCQADTHVLRYFCVCLIAFAKLVVVTAVLIAFGYTGKTHASFDIF